MKANRLDDRLATALSRPSGRPLAVRGRSGSGKTRILRRAADRAGREVVWLAAFDLVNDLADAIREDRLPSYRRSLIDDERPLCVEHLEDLRGKPRTRAELERLLRQVCERRPVVLTLTHARGDANTTRWLGTWTELVSLRR